MNASPSPNPGLTHLGRATMIALVILVALLAPAATRAERPSAIDVQYFRATLQGDSVLLEWRTGTEIDTSGFQVWRSEIPDNSDSGVPVQDFPPQGDTAGFTYQYTDTGVVPGRTYYYTLVAYDLNNVATSIPSEPPGIAIPEAQQNTPTATPTQQATATPTRQPTATPTGAVATATPANTGLQPITPATSGALLTSTPASTPITPFTPVSTRASPASSATPVPVPPPAPAATSSSGLVVETTATPVAAAATAGPAAASSQPPQTPQATEFAATPVVLAQAPAAATPTSAMPAGLPTRGARPTAPPAPRESNPQAILGVIALGSMITALLLAGLMVLIWLRWRSGG